MPLLSQRLSRSLAALFGLALAAPLALSAARAQMAPVGGDHYAARESDTGFAGAVNAGGRYATSLPLNLPGARGGLRLPVHVVYGGRRFGAAGLGWDVPLSSIRRDVRVANRRPANFPDASPQAREQVTLTLDGVGTALVRKADDTGWVARRNDAQLEVRDVGGGVLELYDGNGLRYSFSSSPAGASQPLDNGNLYLLQDIFGPGGTRVHLTYTIGTPSLAGTSGAITGLSIDLASVSYNYDVTGSCAKHQVNLVYGSDDPHAPLSLTMLGNTPLARMHKLHAIDVTAREAAADQPQPCSGPMRSLRTYNLDYQNDADTGQFQLHRVTMIGRENTDERNATLPVATYTYGQVTLNGQLIYQLRQRITSLPEGVDTSTFIAKTVNTPTSFPPQTNPLPTTDAIPTQNLLDVNGDGRPDLLYRLHSADHPIQTWALNKPDPVDPTKSIFTPIDIPNPGPFGYQTQSSPRQMDKDSTVNGSQVWVQMIDMNADGRVDIVVANEIRNSWVVHLNKPDPQDPNRIVWEWREIDIRPLLQYLPITPATIAQNNDGVLLPLSSTVTGHDQFIKHCWFKNGLHWHENPSGFAKGLCSLPVGPIDASDTTITQWALQDINGDGYPDLVFNTSTLSVVDGHLTPPDDDEGDDGDSTTTAVVDHFDFTGPNEVKAILNVAGVHLSSGNPFPESCPGCGVPPTSAFSAPITLDVDCAVSRWTSDVDQAGRSATTQVCGFQDINGDGLPDRLSNGNVARLGTGDPNAPFSNAILHLPGPAARSESQLVATDNLGHYRPAACPSDSSAANYPIRRTNGFGDLNGDGIPDYLAFNPSSGWTVAFGTGVGFAAPKPILNQTINFELSLEQVGCSSGTSGTAAGLYNFYGEGQPAYVEVKDNGLNIYSLSAGVHPASAGLLTRIDNGYGASTNISYRSAKEDTSTNHLVPSPEVVVTAVTRQDRFNSFLSPKLYAYGDAKQFFDPALDRWVFPGYRRTVSLQNTGDPNHPGAGNAVISDALPLDPFDLNVDVDTATRFLRYLKAGRVSDVTTISGELGADPWALLTTDIRTDARRIAASHMEYAGRLLPVGKTGNESCVDMLDPYNYTRSNDYNTNHGSFDQCAERGFALQTSVISYRGTPGTAAGTADVITSPQIVQTGSLVTAFDDLGRVTDITNRGDLADDNNVPNDNLCTHVDYATPQTTTTPARVLNAVARQTVQDCNGVTLAAKRFEYDGLTDNSAGQVTNGFLTSSTVTRYDGDTHASLGDIRLFDAAFDDSGNGNLRGVTKFRDDGAVSAVQYNYDAFGLVVTSTVSTAIDPIGGGLPAISTSSTFDPVTLNRTSTTDANGTVSGTTYDGFGRVVRSKVTPPAGTGGVMSAMSYTGFELVDTDGDGIPDSPDPTLGERSIAQKVLQDAVPEANVATAPGRIRTTFLDDFGRLNTTKSDLGANYPNKVLTFRSYDALGRVNFKSDPYEEKGSERTLYGTTFNYNADGTPSCIVRGPGLQPANASVDQTNEVYPTCFSRSFADNQEILARTDADALLSGSPQFGVKRQTILNAIGRTLESRTLASNGSALEDVAFGYDALGHLTSMKRYQDPVQQTGAVTTTWHYDSLGWRTKLEEQGVAAKTRTFNSWGEITQVQWCDDLSAPPCPSKDRRTVTRYDARGRVIHREDQINNSGHPVPGSAMDYSYDANGGAIGGVPQNNVLGRLASATWSTGQVWFTYDAFGRVNSRAFIDTTLPELPHHYEVHEFHDDGSEKTLHLALQDTNKEDEKIDYGYDSAGRITSAVYNFRGTSQTLFAASGENPIYDIFGHLTAAQYGLASFNATYANTGRRLLTDLKLTSGNQTQSREIAFPVVTGGLPAYDPMGRERGRRETTSSGTGPNSWTYDPLGRLIAGSVDGERDYSYDALGNIQGVSNPALDDPDEIQLSYNAPALDRVCSISYNAFMPPQTCNVLYDGAGNITSMPARSGTRTLSYFPNGAVSTIIDAASNASFAYDAFGKLQKLDVTTLTDDPRVTKYFGAFIEQRREGAQQVLARNIPLPGGVATKHGPAAEAPWTFAFGDGRGTRYVTDKNGAFVQDIAYQPYGEAGSRGATPGTANYTSMQWNGGDLLKAFGVFNLGARVYDPVIGRFLARDPILQASNPYAFAGNDPVNKSDPTGMYQACGTALTPPCGGGRGGDTGGIIPNPQTNIPDPSIDPFDSDNGPDQSTAGGPAVPPQLGPSDMNVDFGAPWAGGPSTPGGVLSGLFGFGPFSQPGGGGGPSPTTTQSAAVSPWGPTNDDARRLYSSAVQRGDVQEATDLALGLIVDHEELGNFLREDIGDMLDQEGYYKDSQVKDIKSPRVADALQRRLNAQDRAFKESVTWRRQAVLDIIREVNALTGPRQDVESIVVAVEQIIDRQSDRSNRLWGNISDLRREAIWGAMTAFPELWRFFPRP